MSTNQTKPGGCGCQDSTTDKDISATQVSINKARAELCIKLYDTKGKVSQLETKFNGGKELYKEKRCIFIKTEENYQRYRNFDISAGNEILQTNESIKVNVTKVKDWNKNLNTILINISKQVKDLKSKFTELKDAACKLKDSYDDKCNAAQRKAMTGKTKDKCDDQTTPITLCKDTHTDFESLICIPQGLKLDADSIFQVASDVVGIQLFSNIDSLDLLQKDLSTKSIAFEKTISDPMKARKTDLDKLQDDLVASVKAVTQAAMDRNWERSSFEGYKDATKFLCCPNCGTLCPEPPEPQNNPNKPDGDCKCDCPPRLKHYEECICTICGEVQKTFCCHDTQPPTTQPPNHNC